MVEQGQTRELRGRGDDLGTGSYDGFRSGCDDRPRIARGYRDRLFNSGIFGVWRKRPEPHFFFRDVSRDDIRSDDVPVHVGERESGDVVSQLQESVQVIEPLNLGAHHQGFNLQFPHQGQMATAG